MWTPGARRRIALLLGLAAAAMIAALAFSDDDASHPIAGELDRPSQVQLGSLCAPPHVILVRPDPILLERELPVLAESITPRVSAVEIAPAPLHLLRAERPDRNLWKRLLEAMRSVTFGDGDGARDEPLSRHGVAEACNQ